MLNLFDINIQYFKIISNQNQIKSNIIFNTHKFLNLTFFFISIWFKSTYFIFGMFVHICYYSTLNMMNISNWMKKKVFFSDLYVFEIESIENNMLKNVNTKKFIE